jgi:glycosyltransferase involved in cell wall biosynthesis
MAFVNVAHCIHGLGLGGAQQIVRYIVGRAEPRRFRYFVYSSLGGIRRREVEATGATVRVIPRRIPKLDPFWARKLAKAMKRDRIDVVHTHLFGDSLHGYLGAKMAGDLPVIMTLHNVLEGHNYFQRLGYRWLVPRCTRAVSCSEFVRSSFVDARVRNAARIVAIPNGIEDPVSRLSEREEAFDFRRELDIDPRAPVIASIGRLVEQKGLDDLIVAFSRVESPNSSDPVLVILGDGPLRDDLERQSREHDVADRVRFAGFRQDISRLMPQIDVVAFSSLWEGLPVALLEAMAFERCIVGTEIPGILEAVRHDKEAILVPPRNVERLSEALRQTTFDVSRRSRLGRAARFRFLERFTARRMVDEYETVYREAETAID